MKYTPLQKNKGYTLLFAVLVSSLVLAIGISILFINKKELLLTIGARDSAAAFYAADAGLECGIYADDKRVFEWKEDNTTKLSAECPFPAIVWREKPTLPIEELPVEPNVVTFKFHIKLHNDYNSCAEVIVRKSQRSGGNGIRTSVESRGYNTGWQGGANGSCNLASPKRVERAIRYSF